MRYWPVALALGASLLLCGPVLWTVGDAITYCRAVALGDLDADGDLDAFLANGRNEGIEPNTAWLNDDSGRFGNSGSTWERRTAIPSRWTISMPMATWMPWLATAPPAECS